MIDLSRPFSAASHPARAYLLQKGVYLLLAFDTWFMMLPHGARYGMGGFNVAHFAWLDAWLPVPSAAFYTGLTLLLGLLALLHVLTGGARFVRVIIVGLYSAAWMVSLFDSYQHHYLLSWILLWTVFMPDVPAESAARRDVEHVRGFGLPMTAITCGIVYSFTAIAKSEADWRAGHVLARLSKSQAPGHSDPGVLDPLRDLVMSLLSVSEPVAWALVAHSVIALQVTAALGYFAAAGRDAAPSRLRSFACALALGATLSFHAFAEIGGMFDIGWFSYYMLWLAFVTLSPAPVLAWVARAVAWPGQKLEASLNDASVAPGQVSVFVQLVLSALLLLLLGFMLDLPGAVPACALVALLVLGWGLVQLAVDWLSSAQSLALAATLSAAACFVAFAQTDARYDYYRWAGGELRALGELESALSMYRRAEQYAGPGRTRKRQIRELEQMLRATPRESD